MIPDLMYDEYVTEYW